MKLIYISQGNVPSKYAHSIQAVKMADAFSRQVQKCVLLTSGAMIRYRAPSIDIADWYGVSRSLRVLCLPVYWRLQQKFEDSGISTYPKFDLCAAMYARLNSPDLVYTRSPYAGYMCAKLRVNTVIETHMEPEHPKFRQVIYASHKPHLRGLVTVTDELKDIYHQSGIPLDKIFVWPDAVDFERFEALPPKVILRQKLKLPHNAFIATYCGHLYEHRGIESILQCAAQMSDVYFLFVGGWDHDVEQRREESKSLPNVNFTGFVQNNFVPQYLAASDVLLMPHSSRCSIAPWMSPLKMFEYMASKRPIIASDLPVLHKHLTDGRNALLVEPDNPHALEEAIKNVKSNPENSRSLADTAYDDVRPYTWDNRARAVLARFSPQVYIR